MADNLADHWIDDETSRRVVVACSIVSFVSLCLNTPETRANYPVLDELTMFLDISVGLAFLLEMTLKMYLRWKHDRPYRGKDAVLDAMDNVSLWMSIILQAVELNGISGNILGSGNTTQTENSSLLHLVTQSTDDDFWKISLIVTSRSLRAFVIIRAFRYFLSSVAAQMRAIVIRASQHIAGVTLFLIFFILLYGIVGVQLFGDIGCHCVTNDTDPENVTLRNLAIPDTTCSQSDSSMCPESMVCKCIHLHKYENVDGSFENIAYSLKTVYSAASQEGWVFLMYKSIDSHEDWRGYLYFMSLIFLLAWLVRNVFIAVIINAFAEIRIKLHNLWGNSGDNKSFGRAQLELSTDGNSWKLVATDDLNAKKGIFKSWQASLSSRYFHIAMQFTIILNVFILAFQPRNRLPNKERLWDVFSVAELIFTVVFDLEAALKICCMGIKEYLCTYLYEAFLALATTINAFINYDPLRSVPILRIIRLVKLSPTLEGFVYKILGPTKKIGALVILTFSIIVVMSCFSLQLFCHLESLYFKSFPVAFMSMFQILTQEGWIDVMHDVMDSVGGVLQAFVTIYFIAYHFFATTVLVSLFVAVILDNLEYEENVKKFKQQKNSKQSFDTKQKLPWRLAVFGRFPNRPQTVNLPYRVLSEFEVPCIRDSYMRQFMESSELDATMPSTKLIKRAQFLPPDQPLESPAVGFALKRGLRLQFAGAVMSPNPFIETHHPHPDSAKPKSIGLCRWRSLARNQLQEKMHTSSLLVTEHASYAEILKRCDEYRNPSKKNKEKHSAAQTLSPARSGTNQEAQRKERERKETKTRQNGIANIYMLQKQSANNADFKVLHIKRQEALLKRQRQERELRENHPLFDTPLFIVSRESQLRRFCQRIVYSQYKPNMKNYMSHNKLTRFLRNLAGSVTYLDWVMILVTITSCCFIMTETPDNRVNNTDLLLYAELGFVFCMSVELLLKVAAGGLFFTPKPFLKDLGGVLDFFTFLISSLFLITLSDTMPAQGGGQILMVLRSLRPLRIFRLVPRIRSVVIELFRGFKSILMVAILEIAWMFIFANLGVEMFGGKLAACNDRTIDNREDCTGIFFQHVWISNSIKTSDDDYDEAPGFMVPRVWTNPRNFNFDSIGPAMLTLFEVVSLKGWIEVRDILAERFGMIYTLYIHVYVFLGSMVGLTLFIGVVVANYNQNNGNALLTMDQRRWENLKNRLKMVQLLHLPPRPPGNGIRSKAYDLSQKNYFKIPIMFCISAQALLLFVKWIPDSDHDRDRVRMLAFCSIGLNAIFLIEIIIKWVGMTFSGMIASWRNRYDLVITAASMIWSFFYPIFWDDIHVCGVGVILIILRFISVCGKRAELKMLMMTVGASVCNSFFIIGAMFLLMLCYAFAGVVLFGTVKYGENIDRHANFGSAPLAITILFRIVTGEDWNKIMHDCMIQPEQCTTAENYWESDCGNAVAALVYFCSFYVIIAYIMLNVLVAIIMENFSLFYTMDEDTKMGYNDVHAFQLLWNSFDNKRKGTMSVRKARQFLGLYGIPCTGDKVKYRILYKRMCREMYVLARRNAGRDKAEDGKFYSLFHEDSNLPVSFHDILLMLAHRSVDIRKSLKIEEYLVRANLDDEIEEAVAMKTIFDFVCAFHKKNKKLKQTHSTYGDQFRLNSEVAHYGDDADDASEENCEFSLAKTSKHRKLGMWRGPPAFTAGSTTSMRQRRPISESDVESATTNNALNAWWSDIISR